MGLSYKFEKLSSQLRKYDQGIVRTNRFSNSYFQNVLSEWNLLNNDIKNSTTISEFKNRLLKTCAEFYLQCP